MATSRTGTGKYLRARQQVLNAAKMAGLTRCPGFEVGGRLVACGVLLDYDTPKQPNSAETDHIISYKHGGNDDASNLRVICRTCNLRRNRKKQPPPDPGSYATGNKW